MMRLDVYLVENGYFESREKAKNEILAGNVLVDERRLKPSDKIKDDATIRVIQRMPYVSRGGYKLEKAIDVFGIDVKDKVCLDIGASTGGFTDVMLQNGAKLVYAVDVGYGQLHYKLRQDDRVIVMERTNARNLSKNMLEKKPEFASMDVSFISILLILPNLHEILREDAKVMALIKPQFEAERGQIGRNGVVRDAKVHAQVIEKVRAGAADAGFFMKKLDFSPITGPEGNIEFISLFGFRPGEYEVDIEGVVRAAHEYQF